jgi:hypothetical protein
LSFIAVISHFYYDRELLIEFTKKMVAVVANVTAIHRKKKPATASGAGFFIHEGRS